MEHEPRSRWYGMRFPGGALLALGFLAPLVVVLAGCGGGSASAPSTSATPTLASTTSAAPGGGLASSGQGGAPSQFQTCLRQHGVTSFGFRGGAGPGAERPPETDAQRAARQAAFQACSQYAPAGGFGGRGGSFASSPQFTACMRSHGDPGFGQAGEGGGGGGFRNDPAVQKAFAACRSLAPARGAGPGGTSSPAVARYRACMARHGVRLGAPGAAASAPGYTQAAFQAATKACGSLLAGGGAAAGAPAATGSG